MTLYATSHLTQPPRARGAARAQTVEEQRAALYRELGVCAQTPPARQAEIKQALLRLCSPQQIKQAAASGVFVSYARPDELFAIQLAEDMRAAGLPVWLDITDIPADGDWHDAVVDALDRCGLMVMVVSPRGMNDADQRAETERFMEMGKIILPVVYEHLNGAALNLPMQPVDFRHDYRLGLNLLVRLLASPQPGRW